MTNPTDPALAVSDADVEAACRECVAGTNSECGTTFVWPDDWAEESQTHWRAGMRAALLTDRARVRGEEWQDIASAPRNKTMVALLYVEGTYCRYGVGWYMPLEGWRNWNFEGNTGPTHWMPLPATPSQSLRAKAVQP